MTFVEATLVPKWLWVLPDFAPVAELVAWCLPKDATIVVEAKGPKTIETPSSLIGWNGCQP